MAIFDQSMFDPQSYQGGMSGWLQQALQSGLLGRALGQQPPMQPQVGPTYAQGSQGMMGGVPFPIAPQDQNAQLPPNAQPAGPAPPQIQTPQLFGSGIAGKLQNALAPLNPQAAQVTMSRQLMQAQLDALMQTPGMTPGRAMAMLQNPGLQAQYYGATKLAPGEQLVTNAGAFNGQQGQGGASNTTGIPTGEQLDILADRYRATGEVPRVYGALGGLITSQVQARAAQRASTNEPILPAAKQMAANQAGFKGFQSSMTTLGSRLGNVTQAIEEISPLVDQVNKTYAAVPGMTNLVPWNKIVQAGEVQFGNKDIAPFRASVLSAAQAYARMVSPTGQPHQESVNHALSILEQGYSKHQMAAAGAQLIKEADAIRSGNAKATQTISNQYLQSGQQNNNDPLGIR